MVSREQSIGLGFGRHSIDRLVSAGRWSQLTRGIYQTAPRIDGEGEWLALAWAGVLVGGDSARIGGLAAARLHGLVSADPESILVLVDHYVRRVDRGQWRFRRQRPGREFRPPRGNPPRIAIEDVLLDLIDNGSDDPRLQGAAHWLSTAVQQRLTTPDRILAALDGRRAMADRRLITDILSDVADGAHSPLELRYVRDVERAHGLPSGHRQSVRRAGRLESTVRAYRDVFYKEFGLVVELDGEPGHVGAGRLRDLRRDNVATLRGERTLRYGWVDVTTEPCLTAFQVAGGLRFGGWTGTPKRCRRCRSLPETELRDLLAG